MTSAGHTPIDRSPRLAHLWFGLFGAAIAWTIQELVGYAILSRACYPASQPRLVPAPGSWTIGLIVSLLMLLVGVTGGVVAYRSWRRSRQERSRFMALSGIIVTSILLFNLVMNLIVLFLVPACG